MKSKKEVNKIQGGNNIMIKLINGNAIDFMKTLEDESVDLIITDPPYKITAKGCAGNSGGMMRTKLTMQGKVFKHNDIKPIEYFPEFYRLLKDGSHCYVMTNHVNLQEMLNTATECGFHFIKSLIWNKGNKIMGLYYMSQFEYILFFRKGRGKKINKCGTADILNVPNKKTKGEDGKNIHDTEKPVELMKILIENSSQEGELVLDPFIGVGAVGMACKELNRNCIGVELDENYYNMAYNRINNYVSE